MRNIQFVTLILLALFSNIGLTQTESSAEIRDRVCTRYEEEAGILDDSDKLELSENFDDAKELMKSMVENRSYLRDRIIEESISDEEFAKELIYDILPWLIFLVLSIFGYITYVCCYCCDLCCPKIICCKRKDSYSKFQLAWPIVGLLCFCVWVIFSGSFGVYKGSYFTEGYFMMKCKFVTFLDDFNAGNKQDKNSIWLGLIELEEDMNKIKNEYIFEVEQAFPSDSEWMQTDYDTLVTQNNNLWQPNNSDKYTWVKLPPTEDNNNDKDSTFLNDFWKIHTNIYTEITEGAILDIKESMMDTNQQGQEQAGEGFANSINNGIKSIQDLIKSVNDAVFDFDDQTKDVDDDIMPEVEKYVIIYFCVSIVVAVIGIVSAVLVVPLKLHKLRVLMHCSWCIFSIWMIVGFLLSTALYAISVLGFQGCDIMDKVLNDFDELNNLGVIKGDILTYIQTCKKEYNGQGDILVKLGVDAQLDDMRALNTQLGETLEKNTKNQAEFQRIRNQLELGKADLETMLINGIYLDTNVQPESQYKNEYNLLNDVMGVNYCNTGVSFSQQNENTCADWPDNLSLTTANSNGQDCYKIHTYKYQSDGDNNDGQLNNCNNESNNQEFKDTMAWIEEKTTEILDHKLDLDLYSDSTNTYLDDVNDWISGVNAFDVAVGDILDKVDLIVEEESNCLFLGQNIDSINEALCGEMIPDMYYITVNLIVHSIGMFVGSFFLYCAGFRYAQIKRQEKYEDKEQKPYERTNEPIPN